MKKLGIALAIAIAAVGAAHAADLPTTKEVPPPPPVNCFSSLWTYLNSSPADCPLSYAGFTVYATLDAGLGYSSNGAAFQRDVFQRRLQFRRQAEPRIQVAVDAERPQPIGGRDQHEGAVPWLPGWSLVGAWKRDSTPIPATSSTAHARWSRTTARRSSSRAQTAIRAAPGNWTTRLGYIGVSNQTYGTLTVGRVTSLTLDGVIAYDPMGGSYAFSAVRLFRLLRGLRRHRNQPRQYRR